MKKLVVVAMAAAALAAAAMPTEEEFAKASKDVQAALKTQIASWQRGEIADGDLAALMLMNADKFKDEARHYACAFPVPWFDPAGRDLVCEGSLYSSALRTARCMPSAFLRNAANELSYFPIHEISSRKTMVRLLPFRAAYKASKAFAQQCEPDFSLNWL